MLWYFTGCDITITTRYWRGPICGWIQGLQRRRFETCLESHKAKKRAWLYWFVSLLMFYYDGPFQFTDDDFDIPAAVKDSSNSEDS